MQHELQFAYIRKSYISEAASVIFGVNLVKHHVLQDYVWGLVEIINTNQHG